MKSTPRTHTLCALACAVVFLAACGAPRGSNSSGRPTPAADPDAAAGTESGLRVEPVAGGLEVPWSIVFDPDGRMLFTERPGRVRVYEGGRLRPEPLAVIGDVEHGSESGLMGLALHPHYAHNRLLYLAYAYDGGGGVMVRVVRFVNTGRELTDRQLIIERIPAARYHAGTRLRFGPDGKLYITTGDAARKELGQRLDTLAGKTLRLNPDGSVPSDNPFFGMPDARPEIWSYGHRNAQGLDFHPDSGLMFQTEHGPSGFDGPGGGDEVNVVERGRNYGWAAIHHGETRAGMESPLLEYTPACAPASAEFYGGSALRQFKGNLFFGCLRGEGLQRVVLEGRRVVREERLFRGRYGRIREVAEGPDGALYFSTSNKDGRGSPEADDDRIMRIVPAK